MEAQKNTKKYWVLFFTWFVILIALFVVYREFFWLALPGTLTYFAKAMDLFYSIKLIQHYISKKTRSRF